MVPAGAGPTASPGVARAQAIADEVLFPRALDTDRAAMVPADLLDALADAGLYSLSAPPELNRAGLSSPADALRIIEALASGCLTTTFVWAQHHRAVGMVAECARPALRDEWLVPLCDGRRRAGVAFSGLRRPGRPILTATETDGGWLLDGTAPWVTGWGSVDVLCLAARRAGGDIVWALVDAGESTSLRTTRLELAAVRASATVALELRRHPVAADRVVLIQPYEEWRRRDALELRRNGSLSLGVASRSLRLLGPSALDGELAACRLALDTADPPAMAATRAWASDLALRAAAALVVSGGGRSILLDQHAQRLLREAMFLLVSGQTSAIRAAQLERATEASRSVHPPVPPD